MDLFPYRKEKDPELIEAATAAYREAPPNETGRRSAFARTQSRTQPPAGTAPPRGDAA